QFLPVDWERNGGRSCHWREKQLPDIDSWSRSRNLGKPLPVVDTWSREHSDGQLLVA
ncbi:hypothetical protein Leryth_010384, partial [Lithospermum erythrorhizon]